MLTVGYESLSWERLLDFLKPRKDSAAVTITVPADCPIQLGVLSASAVVSGLQRRRVGQGRVRRHHAGRRARATWQAETMSGELAACDIDGAVHFKSMSGGLTLAGGALDSLEADHDERAGHRRRHAGETRQRARQHDVRRRHAAAARRQRRARCGCSSTVGRTFAANSIHCGPSQAPASHTVSGNVGAGTGQCVRNHHVRCCHAAAASRADSPRRDPRAEAEMESKTR